MNGTPPFRIGIDLGGTKTELAALTPDGAELCRVRVATPAHDYDAIVRTVAELVRDAEHALGAPASVGIGTPGSVSPGGGTLRNSNTLALNGQPFHRDVATALGRDVRVANDANCFTLSEATDGAGQGAGVVFGVILGTGTGGGVVVDGRILCGRNGIAGEWGHNGLPRPHADEVPGPPCYCGRTGCIETFLSGPGIASDHRAHTGQSMDAEAIADAAEGGDAGARATLERHADRLARALASVINVLDPDIIVLGGGISNMASLYAEVPARWGAYVFSDCVDTPLVPPIHGDSSGVRGAARLWP